MTEILDHKVFGEKTQEPTLVIAHGLFGSKRNWQGLARNLSSDRQVITVDMRNHGNSFHAVGHTYFDLATDLYNLCSNLDAKVDVLGHSMGGKAAMVFALRHPSKLNRLLVADIAPVPYQHNPDDNIEIMQGLDISSFSRRSDAEKAMVETVSDPSVRAFIAQSLLIDPEGNRWALNLEALSANMRDIVGFPQDLTGQFTGPTVFIRGENSNYVSDKYHPAIKRMFPHAEIIDIPNAGHWVHAENPRDFLVAVRNFLTRA